MCVCVCSLIAFILTLLSASRYWLRIANMLILVRVWNRKLKHCVQVEVVLLSVPALCSERNMC